MIKASICLEVFSNILEISEKECKSVSILCKDIYPSIVNLFSKKIELSKNRSVLLKVISVKENLILLDKA